MLNECGLCPYYYQGEDDDFAQCHFYDPYGFPAPCEDVDEDEEVY